VPKSKPTSSSKTQAADTATPSGGAAAGIGKARKPRIIKKYPNRRLYDTEESRYITLSDIRRLVIDKVNFVVIDKKSGHDITRSILLQVISEQEQTGEPIMSRDFLSHVIRSYGGAMQGLVAGYLEQSLKLFMSQQQHLRERVRDVVGVDPVGVVAGIAQKNYQRWKSVQEEIFRNFLSSSRQERDAADTAETTTSSGTSSRSGRR
jgi:polyhydroxyalkanoate synthesis repressor PhaR